MANATGISPIDLDRGKRWPIVGALLAALGASACCILPIVGAALGLGTLGAVSSSLTSARPLFLLGAGVLVFIGAGRVLAARRAKADACGCEADMPSLTPTLLMIGAVVVAVLALAFVPELLVSGGK